MIRRVRKEIYIGRRLELAIIFAVAFVDCAQLRKTHPIELTIKSGSIRGEYLVSLEETWV
jgi:hypothetical protein